MNSHHRFSGVLLAGVLALAAGTPASALTEDGRNLLDRLRNRIEAKEAAAAKPVETVAPPVEFKTQTPPAQTFEPGSIQVEPSPEDGKKEEDKKAEKSSSSRPAKKSRSSKESKAEKGKFKADLEKIIKTLHSPTAPPIAPSASVATGTISRQAQSPVDAAQPAAGESARSFGELSDAELIQYANEHMWSKEKSRKHNPPYTPPSKPKKKQKDEKEKANAASTKKPVKKTGSPTTKSSAAKGKS
ncbi:MAG: hypothetical protein BWY66_01217 [bacterium ADurb.Bin374]|nr:MAG: hypothetical protein BWY66_01217 [bacterium ADurb.Bin374]